MPKSCHVCQFRPSCIIETTEDGGLDRFSGALRRYTVKGRDKTILNQGEPNEAFLFLCNGVVKIVKALPDGRDVILEVMSAFSMVNLPPAAGIPGHSFSAVTLSATTELASARTEDLFKFLDSYPMLGNNLCGHVARRFTTAFDMISSMRLGMKHRILTVLSLFKDAWQAGNEAAYVKVPLTQCELAQLVQTTPETISRALRRLKQENVIRVSPKGELFVAKATLRNYLDEQR